MSIGGICWYCYWGWSKQVAEIYTKHEAIAGYYAMHFGSAHIVWEDENFERHHIEWCLDHFDEYLHKDSSVEQNEAVRQSLIELLQLPDEILTPEPEDYDGNHPENYKPTVEMVRV